MNLSLVEKFKHGSTKNTGQGVVMVQVGEMTLALSVSRVLGIAETVELSPIPLAPKFIPGCFLWHGRIVTGLDLVLRLGLNPRSCQPEQMGLLTEHNGHCYVLMVDAVREILPSVSEKSLVRNPPFIGDVSRFCRGIVDYEQQDIPVLDIDLLCSVVADSGSPAQAVPKKPELRLVATSDRPDRDALDNLSNSSTIELFAKLGGEQAVNRLADGIAFRILDDDDLNPFLGSLNALQFPELVAGFLTQLLLDKKVIRNEAMIAELRDRLIRERFDKFHMEQVLRHVADTLKEQHLPEETRKALLALLREAGRHFCQN